MTIRFKIMEADSEGLTYLPFAKKQVNRWIASGLHDATRTFEFGSVTVRIRLIFDTTNNVHYVRIWLTGGMRPIAYCTPRIDFDVYGSTQLSIPGSGLAPYLFSSSAPFINPDFRGVQGYADLPQLSPLVMSLTGVKFSDDVSKERPQNVTGVNDTPLYKRCVPSVGKAKKRSYVKPPVTEDILNDLYDCQLGDALAACAGPKVLAFKTPDSMRDVFHEYAIATWWPVYFWKEKNTKGKDEIWTLCSTDNNLSDQNKNYNVSSSNILMPCSASPSDSVQTQYIKFLRDFYVDDSAIGLTTAGRHLSVTYGRSWLQLGFGGLVDPYPGVLPSDDLKLGAEYLVTPTSVVNTARAFFVKAKLIDFANANYPATKISVPRGGSFTLQWLDKQLSFPLPDKPDGTPIQIESSDGFFYGKIAGAYDQFNVFKGIVTPINLGPNVFRWRVDRSIPDTWLPHNRGQTPYDYEVKCINSAVTAIPFADKGELIDLRPMLGAGNDTAPGFGPTNYNISGTFNGAHDAFDNVVGKQKYVQMSSSYFNGIVAVRAVGTYDNRGQHQLSADETQWMHFKATSAGVFLYASDTGSSVSNSSWKGHLVVEHRGNLLDVGETSIVQNDVTFTPSATLAAQGAFPFTYNIAAGVGYNVVVGGYDMIAHPEVGYMELYGSGNKLDPNSSFPFSIYRIYKNKVIDFINAYQPQMVTWQFRRSRKPFVPEWNNAMSTRQGDLTVAGVEQMSYTILDYPDAARFVSDVSKGMLQGYDSVCIYMPNLKDGKPGFCLLRLMPDYELVRQIYYFISRTNLPLLRAYVDRLVQHTSSSLYIGKDMVANARALQSLISVDKIDSKLLEDAMKALLHSSYEVLVNNFASPELMAIFTKSVVILPKFKAVPSS